MAQSMTQPPRCRQLDPLGKAERCRARARARLHRVGQPGTPAIADIDFTLRCERVGR